jgi:hypothetical protein
LNHEGKKYYHRKRKNKNLDYLSSNRVREPVKRVEDYNCNKSLEREVMESLEKLDTLFKKKGIDMKSFQKYPLAPGVIFLLQAMLL